MINNSQLTKLKSNEIIPLLDELCRHKILPRYGQLIEDGFTINHAYELLENINIHLSKKTIERRLNALVKESILLKFIAGRAMAYRRSNDEVV